MIEIRVPKEIKNYKSKLFFGMSVRQCICFGAAVGICVPLYIFGKKIIDEEIVSWLVILIASPLMLMGFFTYNGMKFETFAKEWFFYYLSVQKRKYEYEPIYMDIRKGYLSEELSDEIIQRKAELKLEKKKRKGKNKKNKIELENESGVDKNAKEE